MNQVIFKKDFNRAPLVKHTNALVAEYEIDEYALDVPCDMIILTATIVSPDETATDVIRLGYDQLEAIYLAAKKVRESTGR